MQSPRPHALRLWIGQLVAAIGDCFCIWQPGPPAGADLPDSCAWPEPPALAVANRHPHPGSEAVARLDIGGVI